MFLQKIVIENVRSIEHLELSFTGPQSGVRKWTFLLGENGTGKSTVLRSIALVLAGGEALPELLVNPDTWIRSGKKECAIHVELVTAGNEKRAISLNIKKGDYIKDVFGRNKETLDALDSAIRHTARNYMTIGYGVSRRLSSDKSLASAKGESYRHPRAQAVATLFSPDATLNPLESWAMDLDYRRKSAGLKIVKSALSDLLPGVAFKGIDKRRRELIFETPDGQLPLALLSDGYQNVAAWTGDLLYRITETFADHKNPLAARGLLMIDEIDLHLHPLWKRQLIDFLNAKLPNFQLIATTHSALTIHEAGEGELFVLKREKPASPATLVQYEGAPRNLMLQQLLISPLFGLETADSPHVEKLKNEYRQLKAKSISSTVKAKSASSAKLTTAIKNVEAQIEELPDWETLTPRDRKRLALLEKIQQALGDGAGEPKRAAKSSTESASKKKSGRKTRGAKVSSGKKRR